MPFDIGALAQQTAGGVIGAGMGLLLEGHNDRRQLRQEGKLQALNIAGQKEMGEFNYEQQMRMWRDTNYQAQMEELRKAGLSPGLIYGMKGGGGVTTGNQGGSVGGGHAPTGGGESMAGIGMGLQLAMTQAQIGLTEAQTEKTKVETEKTAGVDTDEAKTRIASLTQGITNAKVVEALQNMELKVQGATVEERIDQIKYYSEIAMYEQEQAERTNYIQKATRDEQVAIIRAMAVQAILNQALTKEQTGLTKQKTETEKWTTKREDYGLYMDQTTMKKMASDLMIGWDQLSNEQRKTRVAEIMAEYNTTVPPEAKELLDVITQGVDGVFRRTGTQKPNKVGFR